MLLLLEYDLFGSLSEYNGSQFAPPGVYTEASVPHFGYTLYIPPSDHCRTCSKPYPNNKTYSVFNEDLYRSIVFEEKQEVDVHGYRLFRFELSDSKFVFHFNVSTSVIQYT